MAESNSTENPSPDVGNTWERYMAKIRGENNSTTKEIPMGFSERKKKALFWAVILVLTYIAYAGLELYRDWRDPKADLRDKFHAQTQLDIAKINSEKKAVDQGALAPIVSAKSAGVEYNCNSAQSVQAGFRKGRLNYLSEDQSTAISGCTWIVVSEEVIDISGENFLIEFPHENGSAQFYKSPSEENPDPVAFWNRISNNPQSQGRAVRVLTTRDGFVTITKKGS